MSFKKWRTNGQTFFSVGVYVDIFPLDGLGNTFDGARDLFIILSFIIIFWLHHIGKRILLAEPINFTLNPLD